MTKRWKSKASNSS